MRTRRIVLSLACALAAQAGAVLPSALAEDPPGRPVIVPSAEQFDLRSKSGLDYRIFLAGPTVDVPEAGAPVIYLTDANLNFPLFVAAARQRTRYEPRAVIVGIGYPGEDPNAHLERRIYDMTPSTPPPFSDALGKRATPLKTGGNDAFLKFIEEELKPVVERRYKIDRSRQALFGHSVGGLFVLHVLLQKPEAFQTYLAVSPSVWWNDGSLLDEEKAFLERYSGKDVPARLFISVGGKEAGSGPPGARLQPNSSERRRMVGNVQDVAKRLASSSVKNMSVLFYEFPDEEHGTVVMPAASRGVRYALDGK